MMPRSSPRSALLLALPIALLSCKDEPLAPPADVTAWMVRASLDLRGIRPSEAELARLTHDPGEAAAMVDQWLDDPRFELRVRDLFARVWRTRVDQFEQNLFGSGGYSTPDTAAFISSVGDEPLVLIGKVAAQDRPHTDIVTSATTWANGPLAKVFPVSYPEDGQGWLEVTYTDGRPMAGVLSTNGLWWRYLSTNQNFNRGRANALSRILLCSDFAARPVAFSRSGVESTDGEVDRTQTDPSCLSCHSGLDPLASLLYGFHSADGYTPTPFYALARERDWMDTTGVEPAYFGKPVVDLRELGIAIASDPRFLSCAVEQVYTGLYRVEPESVDPAVLGRHHQDFLEGGARLKALYRSIVLSPEYRDAPLRLLPVESLSSAVEDLTGFRWEVEGADMLGSDERGLRTLGGGMDGRMVTRPATAPSATTVLVTERLAELAAPYAVAHDGRRPAEEQLFSGIDFTETLQADRDELERTVRRLILRAFGRQAEAEEVAQLLETWSEASALSTPQDAWAAVLAVLMRDPEFVLY